MLKHKDIFISNVLVMVLVVINNTKIITLYNNNKCNRGGRVGDASLSSASDQ